MTYERLSIYEFGTHLLSSKDIDPVYPILQGLERPVAARWCLAYWCLYHAGVASYIAEREGDAYWSELGRAALNKETAPTGERWPRGKERRHWRGEQSRASQSDLVRRYFSSGPEAFLLGLEKAAPDYEHVANFVQSHRGFGPWISFKVADMLEQVFHVHVDFNQAAVFMFKDPKEAALRFWRLKARLPERAKPKDERAAIQAVVDHLLEHFTGEQFLAPNGRRPVGLQEVETILCKWKSHMNGHYPLNNDIYDIQAQLTDWARHSPLAERLARRVP